MRFLQHEPKFAATPNQLVFNQHQASITSVPLGYDQTPEPLPLAALVAFLGSAIFSSFAS